MRGWLVVLLLLMSGGAWADTFIVTSNAGDNGSGTFGEALLKAADNGTAFTDTILFNLPDNNAGRTIKGQGYRLSSNLVIDGTSQPSVPFGISDAKVHLMPSGNFCTTGLLMYSVDHIEIYGLWFSDYSANGGISCITSVIKMREMSYITIGKPGKGNVFSRNVTTLMNDWGLSTDSTQSNFITFQSNFIGVNPVGDIDGISGGSGGISLGLAKNVLIGGKDAREGNIVGECSFNIGNQYNQPVTGNGFITILNNTFGLDYNQQHYSANSPVFIDGNSRQGSDFTVTVKNNSFGHDTATSAIALWYVQGTITITDNDIGALDDGSFSVDNTSTGVYLVSCGVPGKILISDNLIHGFNTGVGAGGSSQGATITRNSIYCNKQGIYVVNREVPPPHILLTGVTPATVAGTTCALCKVEIFSTSQCTQYCQNGQTYMGTVTADGAGNFTYTGAISGQMSATSTDADGTTSEFDGAKFNLFDANISDASCGRANGSVTGLTVWPATTKVHWVNANGHEVGTTTDLLNVPAGAYRAYVEDAIYGCRTYSPSFTLNNSGAPQADASQFQTVLPRCSVNNGSIIYTGYHAANTAFDWLDANRTLIKKSGDSLLMLAPGTYYSRLIAGADDDCFTEYGPFVITNQADTCTGVTISGPVAACSLSDTFMYYTGNRNAGCRLPVHWSLGALTDSVASIDDSVAVYHFTQNGTAQVFAHIEGYCREFLDTLTVQLYPSAAPVNLGADKTICPGASVTLTAPGNMASYVWQDGSAAPTETATQPGTYYVTASDYCRHSTSDTILLSAPSETSLGLQPQYSKCNGDTLWLPLPSGFTNYHVTPVNDMLLTDRSLQVWPSSPTQYTINATTAEGCPAEDKTDVQVYRSAPFSIGADTTICEGGSVKFAVPPGFTGQQWSNGFAGTAIVADEAGRYSVLAMDEHGCLVDDTVQLSVNPKPAINLGSDRPLCGAQVLVLNAGSNELSYEWQDGSQTPTYTVNQPGIYWVQVASAQNCTNADTVHITGYADQPAGFLERTDSICPYETKLLQALGSWSSYSWSTGSVQNQTAIQQAGRYWLTVVSPGGCMATDTVEVFAKNCLQDIYVPSSFTPNGDGKNDVFKPVVRAYPETYYFAVYNRFGQKVFETSAPAQGWNGATRNSGADDATTYVWYCNYTLPGKAPQLRKGTVVLVR